MSKKFLTMADKVKHDIERIKAILVAYEERDINEIRDNKEFMRKQLKELEELYVKYQENNEPYYEPYTYEYYKKWFLENSDYTGSLRDKFINEVSLLVDKDFDVSKYKPSQKIKILEDLIKAYNEVKSLFDKR